MTSMDQVCRLMKQYSKRFVGRKLTLCVQEDGSGRIIVDFLEPIYSQNPVMIFSSTVELLHNLKAALSDDN